MRFKLDRVKEIIVEAGEGELATGDDYVDELYDSIIDITGHTNPYYSVWHALADEFHPATVVELGAWRGIGAVHFAVGGAKNVLTIDIHREDKVAQKICQEIDAKYENFHYVNAWTWDAIPQVKPFAPIDILVIDAWHEYQYAMREWTLYEPLLADEALVICDDIFDAEGATVDMVKFWEEISKDYENFLDTSIHAWIPVGFFRYVR